LEDLLNIIQAFALIFFLIGMILRFIPNQQCYIAGRIFYCFDLIFWFIRSLHAYRFIRSLGPKILMIIEMVKEMAYFMMIVLLAIFAFGIATQGLMFHNQDLDSNLLKNVFFPAYFIFIQHNINSQYYTRDTLLNPSCKFFCERNFSFWILNFRNFKFRHLFK
jgi:hypothetical protein